MRSPLSTAAAFLGLVSAVVAPVGWLAGRASLTRSLQREPEAVQLHLKKRARLHRALYVSSFLRPDQQRPAMTTLAVWLWGHALRVKPCKTIAYAEQQDWQSRSDV